MAPLPDTTASTSRAKRPLPTLSVSGDQYLVLLLVLISSSILSGSYIFQLFSYTPRSEDQVDI